MAKRFSRLFAFALVCMLITSLAIPASAAELHIGSDKPMFGMRVNKVTSFNTTSSAADKRFVDYELPSNATVYVTGALKHSITTGTNIKSGTCYWDGSIYQPGPVDETSHDEKIQANMPVRNLEDGKTYYAYVKNLKSSGYVYSADSTVDAIHIWCY